MTDARPAGAGVGPPAPAPSSVDPVPEAARVELDRIRRRWSELSVDRANLAGPLVRELVEAVAATTAPGTPVPDLGSAVLVDQLAVVVWDACAADAIDGADLSERLTALRRALP
ncbi:hypothetical protein [Phycicoccus sonneratiae]|uniref:MftR C-terminal domain-containing protein n=1 Tax=Phycicoccus sonneratiae TaxID=2807628 RepID=A0ABS2CQ90_9MICO|nr:hypothetical protein [Phycicoccus sonneraticus]MBM6402057.1 hypothetical protein [Phycicoccus sonneraticus]